MSAYLSRSFPACTSSRMMCRSTLSVAKEEALPSQVFVAKYEPGGQPGLGPHEDGSIWSFVLTLNAGFEGGGASHSIECRAPRSISARPSFYYPHGGARRGGGAPISTLLTSARVLLGKGKTSRSPPPHPFPNSPPCRLTRWDVFRKPAHSCGPAAGVQAVRWLGDRFLRPEPAQRAARHGRGSVHHCRLRGTSFAPGSRESAAVAECGDATAATATRAIRLIKKRREEKT